jgi:hypothetical protein
VFPDFLLLNPVLELQNQTLKPPTAGPGHQANTVGAIAIPLRGGPLDEPLDEKIVGPPESACQDVAAATGPRHKANTVGAKADAAQPLLQGHDENPSNLKY